MLNAIIEPTVDVYSVGSFLQSRGLVLVTAESCTAGAISASVACVPGSSAWLEGGFAVYSVAAKAKYLGVKLETVETFNVTSCEVAKEMAEGALNASAGANVAIAVTGVAGPGGGTEEIPVGTVCIAWSFVRNDKIETITEKVFFQQSSLNRISGNKDIRNDIRAQVVDYSLTKLMALA